MAALDLGNVPAAILAGGLATRLRPFTETLPKALVDVGGLPFIDYQLDLLARRGFRRIVLCVGYLGEMIEQHVRNGDRWGLSVAYSHDGERLLGSGGALRRAQPLLGDTFWVMYGDSYMDIDYAAVLDRFARSDALGLMVVLRNQNQWDRSNVVFHDATLIRYDKRQPVPEMTYIDYGAAILTRTALEQVPLDEPSDLADLYSRLVADGHMTGYEVTQRFYEIGTPEALAEASAYLSAHRPRPRV